jgi:hypothetical protein
MRSSFLSVIGAGIFPLLGLVATPAQAQSPLGYVTARGSTVTPAYEGWYLNSDGTITLSWGFYNRNSEEELEIPFGPRNFIEPASLDGAQPTHFTAGRQWGAFGIVLPGDYAGDRVAWTIEIRGKTFMIPANLSVDWEIDALEGEADGNAPPLLALSDHGPWFAGPGGQYMDRVAAVGTPTDVTVWVRDDGVASSSVGSGGRQNAPVTLTWLKHSGPGEVVFAEESARIPASGGSMATTAAFSIPGEYVLRVRANDASGVTGAGHSQCCWTNAFVRVTVRDE